MHRVPGILLIAMPAACRKLGVGGAAAWRLGDEDPRFREAIGRYSRGE